MKWCVFLCNRVHYRIKKNSHHLSVCWATWIHFAASRWPFFFAIRSHIIIPSILRFLRAVLFVQVSVPNYSANFCNLPCVLRASFISSPLFLLSELYRKNIFFSDRFRCGHFPSARFTFTASTCSLSIMDTYFFAPNIFRPLCFLWV
jgi:hypothetical protein